MLIFYAIATALFWGVAEIFYKKGNHANEKYAHLKTTVLVGLFFGIFSSVLLLVEGVVFNPINFLIYLPASACYIVSMACSYFGVRFIAESFSDPIENTSGAVVPILAVIFFKEYLEVWQIIAIMLTVIGIIGIGIFEKNRDVESRKKLGKRLTIVAFLMPLAYMLLDAIGTFVEDSILLNIDRTPLVGVTADTIDTVGLACYQYTFFLVAIGVLIFLLCKKVKFFSINDNETTEETKKSGNWFVRGFNTVMIQRDKIIAALLETAGQFTYIKALAFPEETIEGTTGTIAAPIVGAGTVVLSVLISRVYLKEKLTKMQYVFVCIVFIGIIVLSVFDGL